MKSFLTIYFLVSAIILSWLGFTAVECTIRDPEQSTDDANTREIYDKVRDLDETSRNGYRNLSQNLSAEIEKRKASFTELGIYLGDSMHDSSYRIESMQKSLTRAEEVQHYIKNAHSKIDKLFKTGKISRSTIAELGVEVDSIKQHLDQIKWTINEINTELNRLDVLSNTIKAEIEAQAVNNDNFRTTSESSINNFRLMCGWNLGCGTVMPGTAPSTGALSPDIRAHIEAVDPSVIGLTDAQVRIRYSNSTAVTNYNNTWLQVVQTFLGTNPTYTGIQNEIRGLTESPPIGIFAGCENASLQTRLKMHQSLINAAMQLLQNKRYTLSETFFRYDMQINFTERHIQLIDLLTDLMNKTLAIIENNKKLRAGGFITQAHHDTNISTCNKFYEKLNSLLSLSTRMDFTTTQGHCGFFTFDTSEVNNGAVNVLTQIGLHSYGEVYGLTYVQARPSATNPNPNFNPNRISNANTVESFRIIGNSSEVWTKWPADAIIDGINIHAIESARGGVQGNLPSFPASPNVKTWFATKYTNDGYITIG